MPTLTQMPPEVDREIRDRWKSALDLGLLHNGVLLEDLSLGCNDLEAFHGLGRIPRYVVAAKLSAGAVVHEGTRHADPRRFLNLRAYLTFQNTIQGKNGAGAISCAGLAVGDAVVSVLGVLPVGIVGDGAGQFESVITVADQIQQSSASNLSTINYLVTVKRKTACTANVLIV